jgi:hypothetical protein
MKSEFKTRRRRFIIRAALVLVWVGLGAVLFLLNRGHTVLVDNRDAAEPALEAPDLIKVTVDGKQSLEFFRGDRDMFKVAWSRHRVTVEFTDGRPPFETDINLPLGPDMFLLSIPKMINGVEPCIEVFYTQQESRSDDEPVIEDGVM